VDIQSRKYQLTINNPSLHGYDVEHLKALLQLFKLTYFAFGFEKGIKNETEHVHIFLYSSSPIRFSTLKQRFPESHIEKAYGSIAENRDYIQKTGKWEGTAKETTVIEGTFFESGEPPKEESSRSSIMSNVMEDLRSGFSVNQTIAKYPALAFRINDLYQLQQQLKTEIYETTNRTIEVLYCYGDSGTGKTSSVYKENAGEQICRITSYDNSRALFDNYHCESVLVFEEFHSQIKLPEMLSYLDIFPLSLPARYNNRVACYTKVYILSNLPINKQYEYEQINDPKTWSAFLRRISEIRHYNSNFTFSCERRNEQWVETSISPFQQSLVE